MKESIETPPFADEKQSPLRKCHHGKIRGSCRTGLDEPDSIARAPLPRLSLFPFSCLSLHPLTPFSEGTVKCGRKGVLFD